MDLETEGLGACSDRLADTAEAENAELAATQRRAGERERPLGHPLASAQVALGRRQLARSHQQQAHRGVGDFLAKDIGCVGDADALRRAVARIDGIVADAEIGHDLQRRQTIDQRRIDRDMRAAGHRLHPGAEIGRQGGDIRSCDPVDGELLVEARFDQRQHAPEHEDFGKGHRVSLPFRTFEG